MGWYVAVDDVIVSPEFPTKKMAYDVIGAKPVKEWHMTSPERLEPGWYGVRISDILSGEVDVIRDDIARTAPGLHPGTLAFSFAPPEEVAKWKWDEAIREAGY